MGRRLKDVEGEDVNAATTLILQRGGRAIEYDKQAYCLLPTGYACQGRRSATESRHVREGEKQPKVGVSLSEQEQKQIVVEHR